MQKEVKQIICNTRVLTDAIQFASRMHTNLTSICFTMYLVFIFQTYFVLFYSSAGHLALTLLCFKFYHSALPKCPLPYCTSSHLILESLQPYRCLPYIVPHLTDDLILPFSLPYRSGKSSSRWSLRIFQDLDGERCLQVGR